MTGRVALISMTRDRLDFTKLCFERLQKMAGYPFDHYVIDNGSVDGTQDWLQEYKDRYYAGDGFVDLTYLPENRGISIASNIALDKILGPENDYNDYTFIGGMDNDCYIVTDNILKHLVACIDDKRAFGPEIAISPRVSGIVNQPKRIREHGRACLHLGETGQIGGLFHLTSARVMRGWRYPVDLPKAWGQHDVWSAWMCAAGVIVGYIEELEVEHFKTTDGQAKLYPEYFIRKRIEEKTRPDGTSY